MNKLLFRLFMIVLCFVGIFTYVFPWSSYDINMPYAGSDYKLGLDLQGGIELDYKVDLEEAKLEEDYDKTKEKAIIEGLKSIIDKRVETLNINDSVITSASYGGEQHIVVQIPLKGNNTLENNDNIKRAKEAIGRVVKIEFKERRTVITADDIKERVDLSEQVLSEAKINQYGFSVVSGKIKDSYENVFVGTMSGTIDELGDYFEFTELPKLGVVDKVLSGTGETNIEFDGSGIVTSPGDKGFYIVNVSEVTGDVINLDYIFVTENPSDWMSAMDKEGRILNDKYFVKSSVQFNEAFEPMVELTFNSEGAKIFGELSSRLVGQQMAIFVGGNLLTAPNINEPILSGRAVITGSYTADEARLLAQDINTGVVPAPIYLTSEKTIDSKLGASSLQKLIIAGVSGFVLIFIFLIFVYRLSGFIASVALLMYVVIVLAIVKSLGVVLTLASIGGLILSIGMAIDANILIFERVKNEINSGKKLTEAVNVGFRRSWSAIWDSNVTGLIVALILFVFGINMIKGFGLMLALGIVVSLFTVMWISKVLIILASKGVKSRKVFIGK